MAFIHDSSAECAKSELDIFQLPPTQTSIENSFYVEVQPIAALADNAPIEFIISGSDSYYYDLNNTILYVQCKIVKQDNSDIIDGARVGFINYPIASLFSQVDITLADRLISQSDNLYTYRAYIETLLNYNQETLSSQFTAGLFYKDTAGSHNDRAADGGNAGFNKRCRLTARSHVIEIAGPIYGDIFNQPKLVLNGIDLKIKLIRNKDAFCLMAGDAEHYKVQILQASLFVKRVQVSTAVRIGHSQALLTTNAKYPLDRVNLKVFSIPAGIRVTNHENIFLGQLPKTVILGFVDNEAFSGSYQRNPLCFQHFNVNYAALYLDGQQIPARPFKPNFQNDSAIREYIALVQISGKHKADRGLAIDRDEFVNGYTLFAFDLTPDQEPGDHFSLVRTGNLRAEIRFAAPTPTTVNLILYALSSGVMEINQRREILYDYH